MICATVVPPVPAPITLVETPLEVPLDQVATPKQACPPAPNCEGLGKVTLAVQLPEAGGVQVKWPLHDSPLLALEYIRLSAVIAVIDPATDATVGFVLPEATVPAIANCTMLVVATCVELLLEAGLDARVVVRGSATAPVNVGAALNTRDPLPVEVVATAVARFAEVGVASHVAIPAPNPVRPAIGKPVALVRVNALGVPRFGVVKAGDVPKTNAPVPVEPVIAASRLADDGVPSHVPTPVPRPVIPAMGRPVILVMVPEAGVPRTGAVITGAVSVLLVNVCEVVRVAASVMPYPLIVVGLPVSWAKVTAFCVLISVVPLR